MMSLIFALIIGLVLAGFISFAVTVYLLSRSNNIGDDEGTYKDFTRHEMTFISKNKWK